MIVIVIILVLLVVLVLVVIGMYNGLVKLKNKVENAWAQIDVQLKRRYDLIPNLVETVKGYAAHEKGTLEAVIQARNQAMAAQSISSDRRTKVEKEFAAKVEIAVATVAKARGISAETAEDIKNLVLFGGAK